MDKDKKQTLETLVIHEIIFEYNKEDKNKK